MEQSTCERATCSPKQHKQCWLEHPSLPLPKRHTNLKLNLTPAAGELPTLPLSIYGSLAMGHAPNGEDGSQSAEEWFIYKVRHEV